MFESKLLHYGGARQEARAPITPYDCKDNAGFRFMFYAMLIMDGKITVEPTERALQVTKYLTERFFELLHLYRADPKVTPISTMRWLVMTFEQRWRKHGNIHIALRSL